MMIFIKKNILIQHYKIYLKIFVCMRKMNRRLFSIYHRQIERIISFIIWIFYLIEKIISLIRYKNIFILNKIYFSKKYYISSIFEKKKRFSWVVRILEKFIQTWNIKKYVYICICICIFLIKSNMIFWKKINYSRLRSRLQFYSEIFLWKPIFFP